MDAKGVTIITVFGVILVRIFPHSDWILSSNAGKYGPNNSEYGHFSRSVFLNNLIYLFIYLLKLYLPLVLKIAFANKFQLYHKIK